MDAIWSLKVANGSVDLKKKLLKCAAGFLGKRRAGRGNSCGMEMWKVENGIAFKDNVIRIILG